MLHIGLVDFLNAYPLYFGLEDHPLREKSFDLVYEVPSLLSTHLQDGSLDVTLVSSVEYHRHRDKWEYFLQLGICSRGQVESIRFFLHKDHPFFANKTFAKNNNDIKPLQKIYLDYASKSSVEMLKIILRQFKNISFEFEVVRPPHKQRLENLKPKEGLLLIGDQALAHKHYPSVDVGEWYYSIFAQPFVYALWVYRKNLQEEQKKFLEKILTEAYQKSKEQREKMLELASQKFAFDKSFCNAYLGGTIHYELDENFLQAMNFFFENVAEK